MAYQLYNKLMGAPQRLSMPGTIQQALMPQNAPAASPTAPMAPSGGFLDDLLSPEVALPMAGALLAGPNFGTGMGQAFAFGGQALGAKQKENRTKAYLKQNFPQMAALVEAGAPIDEVWKATLTSGGKKDLINAGKGRLYDPNSGKWITAPDMGTDAPTIQTFFGKDGQEYKAQWQNGEWVPVGGSKAPNGMTLKTNPDGTVEFVQGGGAGQKLTEGQSKDVVYFTRGSDANNMLSTMDTQLTSWTQQNADKIPLGLGNYVRDPSFRQAKQAADSFLAAILRKDTGAAITAQEFELYGPMFLPVPGDDGQTIQQKRRAREVALLGIKSGLGTAEAIAEANRILLGLPETQVPPASLPSGKTSGGVEWSVEP